MVNVNIITDNEYLRAGLQSIILFSKPQARLFLSQQEKMSHDYYDADVLIIHVKPGDIYACDLNLKYRRRNRQLIFITGTQSTPGSRLYPCLKGAHFIAEDESLSRYATLLENALDHTYSGTEIDVADCNRCSYRYLTPYQLLILNAIKFNYSVSAISRSLDIKPTTISTQIKRVKSNFGITRNIDLFKFIRRVKLSCNSQLLKTHNILIFAFNIMVCMQ